MESVATYLVLIKLVECLGLNLLQSVMLARLQMQHLINLGVFLATAK